MALPTVKTLFDCSSFSKTVIPFLPQLRDLPTQVFQSYNDLEALKTIYITTNPLITALAISLFLAPIFFLVSEVNRNWSQVDRCWSILPTLYNVHYCVYAHLTGMNTERLDHVVAFSVVWSLRLTFNYWRKGGYSIGSEDYRWAVLRSKLSAPLFFLFSIVFISTAQSLLLFLITTPVYVMLLATLVPTAETMSTADIYFVRGLLSLVLVEFFADQAQWNYYKAKKQYQKTAKVPPRGGFTALELDRGFNTTGLFAYSRHPNFAAEQAIWVTVYQWGCWDSDVLANWTFTGALGYLLLFQASTWFTERITAEKYPDYKEYQKRVGKFVPKMSEFTGSSDSGDQDPGLGAPTKEGEGTVKDVKDSRGKKDEGKKASANGRKVERDPVKRGGRR